MRVTTVLRKLLGLKQTVVTGIELGADELILEVKPTTRVPRCGSCGKRVWSVYDRRAGRLWRHLDFWGVPTRLRYDLRRVDCRRCGVRVEAVPWANAGSLFTTVFEHQVAYLAQRTDRTAVCRLMGIAWRTVGEIVTRVVERYQPREALLDDLRHIGVDELSYRKHHEYITVVTDLERGRVVWAQRGKNAATLRAFFDQLGPKRAASIETVCIDMSAAYQQAVADCVPQAQVVFDRFHVQRLAHDALDAVRRDEVREALPQARKGLKRTRWALQKNPWNLSALESDRLSNLAAANSRLFRAYLLKEALAAILDRRQIHIARRKLGEWISWAGRSRLAPFVKLARTVHKHAGGILAYIQTGLSNGPVEGLNGKARVLTRRAFGFHSAHSLIGLLFLCCSGLHLKPARRKLGENYPLTC